MTATAPLTQRRPADYRDTDLLRRLFLESRDDLLLLPSDVRDVLCDMQLRAQERQRRIDHPDAVHEILLDGTTPVGHLLVDGRVDHGVDVIRLVDLAVLAVYRGRGIATGALAQLVADADFRAVEVQLHVRATNAVARRLYESFGFTYTGSSAAGAGYLSMVRAPHAEAGRP